MDFIIYFFICICAVLFFAFYIRKVITQNKQSNAEKTAPTAAAENSENEFTTAKYQAEVIDLTCRAELVGIKTPKCVEFYTVAFKVADGCIIWIDVPQEMYEGFEKGQKGELTLVDGKLYCFVI